MSELIEQAEAAAISALHYNDARAGGNVAGMFAAVQGILSAAALVSKVLWPAPARWLAAERKAAMETRGEHLRALVSVPDESPLRSRAVRNAFEHFDEHLDDWLEGPERYVVDRVVTNAPESAILIDGSPPSFLRLIDEQRNVVSVLDNSVAIQDLMDALAALRVSCIAWLDLN